MERAERPVAAGGRVEVAHARPERQEVVELDCRPGLTALEAVRASGLLEAFPGIDASRLVLGIFGRIVPPEHELQPGDRVEIYRPLPVDPREARRRLAAAGRTMGQPGRASGQRRR